MAVVVLLEEVLQFVNVSFKQLLIACVELAGCYRQPLVIVFVIVMQAYVTVLEKRDHLATKIIFELCILSDKGHCVL